MSTYVSKAKEGIQYISRGGSLERLCGGITCVGITDNESVGAFSDRLDERPHLRRS